MKNEIIKSKGAIFAFLAVILWSFTFIFVKKGVEHTNPFIFTLFRLYLALPLMFFFRSKNSILVLISVTLVWNLGCLNLMALSMGNGVSASSAAFLYQTNSLFYILFSLLFFKEKFPKNLLFSLPVAFLGLYIFFNPSNLGEDFSYGMIYVMIGAMCWGLGTILLKKFNIEGTFGDVVWLAGLASIIQTPIVFFAIPIEKISFSVSAFSYGVGAFVLTNIFANISWLRALRFQSSSFLSHIIFVIPIFVLLFDCLILGTSIDNDHLIGGLLIILANFLRVIKIKKIE